MKRILNKILCFMWGHQFYDHVLAEMVKLDDRYWQSMITFAQKCKHCGAHKHD